MSQRTALILFIAVSAGIGIGIGMLTFFAEKSYPRRSSLVSSLPRAAPLDCTA
uniref:hypothetical protein n=1 Tax=Streptomyces sp. S501 TaxID=2420135 RepID=UPI001431F99E|nr:hypothetical protein [Streptomyces sp. S501]